MPSMISRFCPPLRVPLPLAQAPGIEEDAPTVQTEPLAPPPQNLREAVETMAASVGDLWHDFLARLPLLLAGLIVLILTWMLAGTIARAAQQALRRTHFRGSMKALVRQMTYIGVWIAGLTVAAVIIFPGMTPARILTVLGLGSIAVGFAFKDIVENFFAGVLILWRFPFENGDYIECGDVTGKVEDTTIRMTLIRQVDGQLVVVPNGQLLKTPVTVMTSRPLRRIMVIAGVAYGEDVDQSRSVIYAAVERCRTVSQEQPIQVFAREFGESSIDFEVAWWTGSTPLEERQSRDEVVAAVKRGLDEAGIEIPFPYRTLTFKESLRVGRTESTRAE